MFLLNFESICYTGSSNMTFKDASGSGFSPQKPRFLKHQIVENEIRQLANTLPVGSKLPAERTMAELYGCNFLTVRKALKRLVIEGMIERRIGSGTFVADKDSRSMPVIGNQKHVGLLVHQHSDAYAHRLLQAIAHAALDLNVHVRSAWISDFGDSGLRLAETLAAGGCSSIVLPWFPSGSREDLKRFLAASPLPVCVPEPISGFENQCFVNASAFGSNECTADLCAYFRQLGAGRVAFLGPDATENVFLQKVLASFVAFNSRESSSALTALVRPGAAAMDQLAQRWQSYRGDLAVICYDDEHALRFMTAMHKIGCSAPDDFRVAGYNDTEASRYSDPPLSSVRQNFDYIGTWMLRNALALAEGTLCQSPEDPKLQLVIRSTCGGASHTGPIPGPFKKLLCVKESNAHCDRQRNETPAGLVAA